MKYATLLIVALGLAACTEENPAYNPDPFLPGECATGVETPETFTEYERPDLLDILVVIDNSGDVDDLQIGLAEALPEFLEGLKEDGLNVQLAVATTDSLGTRLAGPGTSGDGCASNTSNIVRQEQSNWTKLAACNVQQGSSGDPYQQSLATIDGIFLKTSREELGFFRANARTLVLVVSNEDDCSHGGTLTGGQQPRQECLTSASSLSSVKVLTDQLLTIPDVPEGFMFAVISGPPVDEMTDDMGRVRPVCSSALGSVYSARRLYEATEAFGAQGEFLNLCVQDLSSNLETLRRGLLVPKSSEFCPLRKLTQAPLEVTGTEADGADFPILLGDDGFVFEGETGTCENGGLLMRPEALSRAESVRVTYCAEQ